MQQESMYNHLKYIESCTISARVHTPSPTKPTHQLLKGLSHQLLNARFNLDKNNYSNLRDLELDVQQLCDVFGAVKHDQIRLDKVNAADTNGAISDRVYFTCNNGECLSLIKSNRIQTEMMENCDRTMNDQERMMSIEEMMLRIDKLIALIQQEEQMIVEAKQAQTLICNGRDGGDNSYRIG
eukprot:768736_1